MRKTVLLVVLLLLSVVALAQTRTLPSGTTIKVRTDTTIPAKPAAGAAYTASVSDDVTDSSGAVLIPRNSRAQLVAQASPDGKDTTLDLRSVTVNGRRFSLVSPGQSSSGGEGVGKNQRTAKYVGGGAAVGAVLGALMGGGKGAAIGAILGGAGGAGAQTLRKSKAIPAETELSYKLAQDLQMRPVGTRPRGTLQKR